MVNKTDNTHSVKQEHLKSSVNVATIQTVVKALNGKTEIFSGPANEQTLHSCVPFTLKKLNLQRKLDVSNNSRNEEVSVVCRYVTNPSNKGFLVLGGG